MTWSLGFLFVCILLTSTSRIDKVEAAANKLTQQNFDQTLASHELVFVNFYANWCRFSQMLEPIYDDFADKLAKEISMDKVAIGKVDCDSETTIATQNHVNKYPTLKLYRYGVATKKEYRGARSVEAFISFVKEQAASKLKIVRDSSQLAQAMLDSKKRTIVGFFHDEQNQHYQNFNKLSNLLRDSCNFIAGVGDLNMIRHDPNEKVTYRDLSVSLESHETVFEGNLAEYDKLYAWADEQCTPIVREITFENAEELTEEGLPFLILFRKPEDTESLKLFERVVQTQLAHLKNTINAVYADGHKFSHPLHHLGKSASDLPVLAIDSFRHMYLFPDFAKLSVGNSLEQFVQDLHSGKLHREFHNGPDPTQAPQIELHVNANSHIPKSGDDVLNKNGPSTPPESVFIKLAPSRERYSIKYDGEL